MTAAPVSATQSQVDAGVVLVTLEAAPTGRRVSWDGIDSIPFENGLVKRKDVYSDSVSILRQVGLLD